MHSYAQFGTDLVIAQMFPPEYRGRFLDIGASHPIHLSNTQLLYTMGWSGLVVDPSREIDLYASMRPRDFAAAVAVGDRDGHVEFHDVSEPTWSTVSLEEARARQVPFTTRSVPVRRVDTLLEQTGFSEVHFDLMTVDVEGAERAVLEGCPFGPDFLPTVLVVEACLPCTETPCPHLWEDLILPHGYELVRWAGVNAIYSLAGKS